MSSSSPLLSIHYAHLVMLAATDIVSASDAGAALRAGLDTDLPRPMSRSVAYDGSCEDLFYYVERLIVAGVRGEDVR